MVMKREISNILDIFSISKCFSQSSYVPGQPQHGNPSGVDHITVRNMCCPLMKCCVVPQLEKLPTFIIVHDCAPPHWSKNVWTYLHKTFAERWVGHGGLIFCLLSSCHCWQYVKDYVYRTFVDDM